MVSIKFHLMSVVCKTAMSYVFWRVDLPLVINIWQPSRLQTYVAIIDIGYDFYILYCKTSVLGGSSLALQGTTGPEGH